MTDRIPLPRSCSEIAAFAGVAPPSYRSVYLAVLDGRLPAENVRGRWYINRADLPAVVRALGLPARGDAALSSAA